MKIFPSHEAPRSKRQKYYPSKTRAKPNGDSVENAVETKVRAAEWTRGQEKSQISKRKSHELTRYEAKAILVLSSLD